MTALLAPIVFAGLLAALALADFSTFRLPDALTLPLLLVAAVAGPADPDSRVFGILLATGLLAGVAAAFRRLRGADGLGFGDVKLAAGCGAWIGVAGVGPMVLLASLSALAFAAAGKIWAPSQRPRADGAIPDGAVAFGPHIAMATMSVAVAQAVEWL
ncbi:prepilin peptidase [Labrys wisconsinensis]|uniref:Prepilin signal peptidase PulO-like enzyme (Type II secretory pathway) n=1 Tax=Labrys wisconsinensis TaxID=425677 RepID=A0ABU0JIT7_9HYPH|nr:A24 family peptidase [Labrys wisconsinensis]MDQ0473535.1 prepilin signal peptidase PulO-like enzyme (type II secretory pathway) [Labrys wisconsinensis]